MGGGEGQGLSHCKHRVKKGNIKNGVTWILQNKCKIIAVSFPNCLWYKLIEFIQYCIQLIMPLNQLLSYTGQFIPNCLKVNPLLDNLMKLRKFDCQYISLKFFS